MSKFSQFSIKLRSKLPTSKYLANIVSYGSHTGTSHTLYNALDLFDDVYDYRSNHRALVSHTFG
jgi:hypothetical protein